MKTIARNRKTLVEAIFEQATEPKSYRLENSFSGVEVPLQVVRDAFERGAKLQAGTHFVGLPNKPIEVQFFRVTVHSNHWYEFYSSKTV